LEPIYERHDLRHDDLDSPSVRHYAIFGWSTVAAVAIPQFDFKRRNFMDQEAMLKPALIGGVLLGVLSATPLISAANCICCAWVIGGGALASYLFVKESPRAVTLGKGVALGLLAGIIGAVVDTLFSIPLHMALRGLGSGFTDQFRQVLEQIPNLPPETKQGLQSILASGTGLSFVMIILGGLMKLVIYSVMAMLGGAIGVAIFEKRKPGDPHADSGTFPAPPMSPPPPPPVIPSS
jgi:hypothetical protein